MTLNIDIEEVPFAILEAVQARILKGRQSLQQPPPPSLRPRPQQRKFGASQTRWARPRPAVTVGTERRLARLWLYSELADDNGSFEFKIAPGRADRFLAETVQTQFPQDLPREYNVVEASLVNNYAMPMKRFNVPITASNTGYYYALSDYLECFDPVLTSYPSESKTITSSETETLLKNIVPFTEFNHSDNYLILPAGEGVALVIYLWKYDWYYLMLERLFGQFILRITGSGLGGTSGAAAYCVNDTGVREVTLPTALQSVLAVIHPQYQTTSTQFEYVQESYAVVTVPASTGCPTTGTFFNAPFAFFWDNDVIPDPGLANQNWHPWSYQAYESSYTSTQYNHSIRMQPQAPEFQPEQYEGLYTYWTTPITPSIFASLNAAHQFVDPGLIKSYPADLHWIVEDAASTAGEQVLGEYSVPGDPSAMEGTVIIDRELSLTVSDNTGDAFDLAQATGYTVWDWDDPDYCRQMCQALGFTAADLQP